MAKKVRDRKRQTKINFSPAAQPSATNMGAEASKSATPTPTKPTRATPRRPAKRKALEISSDEDSAGETHKGMSMGMPVTTTEHGMSGSSDVDAVSSEEEDDVGPGYAKPRLASRKRRRNQHGSESEEERPKGKGKGKTKVTVTRAKRSRRHSPDSDQSQDEELRLPPSKRIKVTKRQPTPPEEEDDDSEPPAPRSRRRGAAKRKPPIEESTPPRSTRRKIKRRLVTPGDEEEEEEEDDEAEDDNVQEAESGAENASEMEDLQEDLAFLQSSPVADRGKLRSAHEKPKSKRQEMLDAIRRKRAGMSEPSSSATPSRSRPVVVESDSESDLEVMDAIKEEPEDEEMLGEEVGEDNESDESARDANAYDMFLEDEEDENFLDDDVEGLMGEPILGPEDMMPLTLQRHLIKKPKELFVDAIEWMVMKKIHPAFEANSEFYNIAFRKLDDEVKGLANSKFSSAAWTPDFTRAIRARPELMSMDISVAKSDVMEMHCEACNRRNHPASAELMLTGQPYDPQTLEPLEDNESDADGSGSDSDDVSDMSGDSAPKVDANGEKIMYNATGEPLPPASRRFALGRTCRANAQVAHTLHHWQYHLFSWVKEYLGREKYLTAEALVTRDGWKDKKRDKLARKIVKRMEKEGEIRRLYHAYKDQVKYAVDVRHDLANRWGRN